MRKKVDSVKLVRQIRRQMVKEDYYDWLEGKKSR